MGCGLNEFPKVSEGGRFIVMDHVVFDLFSETIIRLPKECRDRKSVV